MLGKPAASTTIAKHALSHCRVHPALPSASAALINYGVNEHGGSEGWRLSLGLAAVPAIILFIASLILPETPNSLIERGRVEEGRRVLAKLRNISTEVRAAGSTGSWTAPARLAARRQPTCPAPPSPCAGC